MATTGQLTFVNFLITNRASELFNYLLHLECKDGKDESIAPKYANPDHHHHDS